MIRRIRFGIGQALNSMIRTPLMQLIAVSTITAAVTILCLLQIAANTAQQFMNEFSGQSGVVAFLKADTDTSVLDKIRSRLDADSSVEKYRILTPREALNQLRKDLGEQNFDSSGIDQSVMPLVVEIELKSNWQQSPTEEKLSWLRGIGDGVELTHVDTGDDISQKLAALSDLVNAFSGLVALLVLVAVLFVISNTMRLAIHARAQEIEIMQWVGASSFYIRLPFYVEGGIQGFFAGILALVSARLVVGSAIFLLPTFPDDFQQIDLAKLSTSFEITLTIGLCCLGILASHLATSRYLKQKSSSWF